MKRLIMTRHIDDVTGHCERDRSRDEIIGRGKWSSSSIMREVWTLGCVKKIEEMLDFLWREGFELMMKLWGWIMWILCLRCPIRMLYRCWRRLWNLRFFFYQHSRLFIFPISCLFVRVFNKTIVVFDEKIVKDVI